MARLRKIRGNGDWVARDGQMAVLAAVLIVFVIAGSLSDGKIIPDFSASAVKPEPAGPTPDEELKTGSIYITPADGNVCEHRLIDNATWRIRPNGHVNCDGPVSWAAQEATRNSAQRMEAIREGFFQKR
jgi:hypothetical protein